MDQLREAVTTKAAYQVQHKLTKTTATQTKIPGVVVRPKQIKTTATWTEQVSEP